MRALAQRARQRLAAKRRLVIDARTDGSALRPLAMLAVRGRLWTICHCPGGRLLCRSRPPSPVWLATIGGSALRGPAPHVPFDKKQSSSCGRTEYPGKMAQGCLTSSALARRGPNIMRIKSCRPILVLLVCFGLQAEPCRAQRRVRGEKPRAPVQKGLVILVGGVGGLDFFISAAEWALP